MLGQRLGGRSVGQLVDFLTPAVELLKRTFMVGLGRKIFILLGCLSEGLLQSLAGVSIWRDGEGAGSTDGPRVGSWGRRGHKHAVASRGPACSCASKAVTRKDAPAG